MDPYFLSADFVSEIRSSLDRKGIANEVFSDLQPDPTDENVRAGTERFRAIGADSILAIGGGSALDVAKMIGVVSTNAGPLSGFQGYHRIPNPGPPLVAMPTTAGTGSEATKVAVITDTERNVKMMILDAKLMPAAAIVDLFVELRHQYLISFEPGEREGWHPLEIRARKNDLIVRARSGYMAGRPRPS